MIDSRRHTWTQAPRPATSRMISRLVTNAGMRRDLLLASICLFIAAVWFSIGPHGDTTRNATAMIAVPYPEVGLTLHETVLTGPVRYHDFFTAPAVWLGATALLIAALLSATARVPGRR